jgi:2-C-methyl-D-erythritol 4-phosphate cytidylyltransferase
MSSSAGLVTAIIVGAGKGRRFGGGTDKAFIPLRGVPLLVHAVRPFEASDLVDRIVLVVPALRVQSCRDGLVRQFELKKVMAVVAGGEERQDSVRAGLEVVHDGIVLVHDAARPFVSVATIEEIIRAAESDGCAIPAIQAGETVKRVDGGMVSETLDRALIWLAQTPQAFTNQILREAYERAEEDGVVATDDATLVERLGIPVRIVPGTKHNIKITTQDDLAIAEALLDQQVVGR